MQTIPNGTKVEVEGQIGFVQRAMTVEDARRQGFGPGGYYLVNFGCDTFVPGLESGQWRKLSEMIINPFPIPNLYILLYHGVVVWLSEDAQAVQFQAERLATAQYPQWETQGTIETVLNYFPPDAFGERAVITVQKYKSNLAEAMSSAKLYREVSEYGLNTK